MPLALFTKVIASATVAVLLSTLPTPVQADDQPATPENHARFTPDFVAHDWRLESLAVGLSAAPLLAGFIAQSHRGGAPDAPHALGAGAASASDVISAVGVGMIILGASGAESARDEAFRLEHLRAALVVGEATLFATSVTELPKRLVGRCRPRDWDDGRKECDPSAEKNPNSGYAAFWSGTTAQIAGAAGAASCLALRERRFGWTAVVGLLGEGAAVATGALRVAAGAHSWTDVGAAFVAGNALGMAMCWLHPAAPTGTGAVARTELRWHVAPGGLSVEAMF